MLEIHDGIRFLSELPHIHLSVHTLGEGQFGQVWEAFAVGICPDHSRNVVAVKTLKRETLPSIYYQGTHHALE